MSFVLLCTAILHAASILFLGLCLIRLFGYLRRHRLNETSHTLLFTFIKIEHVILAYIIFIAVFTVGSVLLILTLR